MTNQKLEEPKEVREIWWPYIKPTRRIHSGSGYRCFEVGYIHNDQKQKKVIHSGSDHIYWNNFFQKFASMVNIDLLKGGEIRFHARGDGVRWEEGHVGFSSMELKAGFVSQKEIDEL